MFDWYKLLEKIFLFVISVSLVIAAILCLLLIISFVVTGRPIEASSEQLLNQVNHMNQLQITQHIIHQLH